MHPLKKYYISSMDDESGICLYSKDFFNHVLKDRGYQFIDSVQSDVEILSRVASLDQVHIEVGLFREREIKILLLMLSAGYQNISVTLHDAPLLKYPLHEFKAPFLNGLSKFYDKYIIRHRNLIPYMRKISHIYVLSERGTELLRTSYGLENVSYLPHVIDPAHQLTLPEPKGNDLLYFGFIGRNKGIEYSLRLHRSLLKQYPDMKFHVAGRAMGREVDYFERLRSRYTEQVVYHGYVPPTKLESLFTGSRFLILPFQDYSFYWPVSGTLLNGMARGKVILTNKVNVIGESIQHGQNGFFLTGNLTTDTKLVSDLIKEKALTAGIPDGALRTIRTRHHPDLVNEKYKG